jgi:hypothetical protein
MNAVIGAVALVWLLTPAFLVYVGLARRSGRSRSKWLGAALIYSLLLIVAPKLVLQSPRAGASQPHIFVQSTPPAVTASPQPSRP